MLIHLNHVAHVYIVLRQHVRQMLLRHDQVKCVSSTHWDDIDVRQSPNQGRHRLNIVIDTSQQDTLVPDGDTCLQQFLRGLLRDPRNLAGVIEVRVNRHRFPRRFRFRWPRRIPHNENESSLYLAFGDASKT